MRALAATLWLCLAGCAALGDGDLAADPLADGRADGFGPTRRFAPSGRCPRFAEPLTVGRVQSALADEVSGLAASRRRPGVLYGHNDSGAEELVFAFSAEDGAPLGTFRLAGATNVDWEDLAIGPGPEPGVDYLYVADTGDNDRERGSVVLYRAPEPEVDPEGWTEDEVELEGVEAIELVYGDEVAHDAETLLVDPVTGDVLIVTKSQDGDRRTLVFLAEAPLAAGEVVEAVLVLDERETEGLDGRAVGGDVATSGDRLVVYFRNGDARLWFRPGALPLWTAFLFAPCEVPRPEGQVEAVAFDPAAGDILAVPEGRRPRLYRVAFERD